jgi:hypothetical protein
VDGFVFAGWALDRGASSGSGVDAIHVWAYPVGGGTPFFVGTGAYGSARPDVAAVFGSQFLNCGYTMVGALPPGSYDLVVYSHSAVTGAFETWRIVRVTSQ